MFTPVVRAPRCDGVTPASSSSHRPLPDLLQGEARKAAHAGVVRAKGRANEAEKGREEVQKYITKGTGCAGRVLMYHSFTLLQHSHKSTRLCNVYSPGRDKTSLGDKKATDTRTQK